RISTWFQGGLFGVGEAGDAGGPAATGVRVACDPVGGIERRRAMVYKRRVGEDASWVARGIVKKEQQYGPAMCHCVGVRCGDGVERGGVLHPAAAHRGRSSAARLLGST